MPSVMSASRPAALMRGPSAKPKSKPAARRRVAPGGGEQRRHAGLHAPARMRRRPCATRRRLLASSLTTSATVPSATRSSSASSGSARGLRPGGDRRAGRPAREGAARAQLGARGQQHVEHHADAGDRLALEAAAGLVGVDDDVGRGRHDGAARRAPAGGGRSPAPACPAPRMRHALVAGDAVVHRHQQCRPLRACARSTMAGVSP
jgi:hypothetical protein